MTPCPADHAPQPHPKPAFQFSLTALFVLTTVFALALSAFFGITQISGVSAWDVLFSSLSWLIRAVPTLIVWSIGLTMALRRLRTHRKPAILTATAMIGLITTLLLMMLVQATFIAGVQSDRFSPSSVSWMLGSMSIAYTVVNLVCWILILIAIFTGRPVSHTPVAPTRRDAQDPFAYEQQATPAPIDDPFE